ncbi:hypothetical protein LPJ78_001526 [Coemansia sp. RSA 989]|nr:hypothetical protein BX667DRAFT_501171 [Coemansia mojavensis]KAJ1748401.1 hypothetical protein LPJ79_004559 [Coemansia sp. RSA 1821]KAJ1866791.1 hypothetical protein LPJ78_001526 [Coemansia sp. RSA 989]KAJ1872994.1 hypothetical protein LPJ55_002631 [Coemansia sp. RSA 990]KAJ2627035.1 hypothetical protein H4R22_004578 [Coemansia sp. RSA 1290]KAJ2646387.1 hypothetical protein IWW40_005457 [Coemansia sp. RSA 1250]KAJ2672438.1 hypothetical protein IWW42_002803 [Coemansia sp. RSA 1085]
MLGHRLRRQFYCFLFHNPVLQDELFATSYMVKPPVLFGIRAAFFVYSFTVLLSNLVVNIVHGAGWNWAAYFTTLTYFGITLYYGVASWTTMRFLRKQQQGERRIEVRTPDSGMELVEDKQTEQLYEVPSVVHQLALASQWLLYETFSCYAPLVTLIYWVLLYPTQSGMLDVPLDQWMGVSMHAVNCLFMLTEVSCSKIPYRWSHFGVVVVFLAMYLGLAYFMVAVYGFYVYPFFESRYFGGYIALLCLLIVNIVAIVWVVMLMVHRLRDTLFPRWLMKRQRSTFF